MRVASAIDGDLEGLTHLSHAPVTQPADAIYQYADRDALHGIEIRDAALRNRVFSRLEQDLAGKPSNRCGAGGDESASQPRDGGVSREHDDGPPVEFRQLAPPDLAASRRHERAAASRNDARSPHSSALLSGISSYAE